MIRALAAGILLIAASAHAQAEAWLRADNPQDLQWARLTILVKNTGTASLNSLKAFYQLEIPAGKVPVVENWNVGPITTSLTQVAGTRWELRLAQASALAPGQGWNNNQGAAVGVHLSDWSNWKPSSSPSWDGNTGAMVPNRQVRVYDASGRLVWAPLSEITPPPSTKGFSTVAIQSGYGGRCNATGTVVLASTDQLQLRCQERYSHFPAEIWLDGVKQATTAKLDMQPDGRDHQVEVRFPPRASLNHTVTVAGAGTCLPAPIAPAWGGRDATIACGAQSGSSLSSILVDGSDRTFAPRVTVDGSKNHGILATFVPTPADPGIVVESYRDPANTDPLFSVYRVRARNTGTNTYPAGWRVEFPVRVPDNVTMTTHAWDVPGATLTLLPQGDGWHLVRITSTQSLTPNSIGGDGRGWYFALGINATAFRWDRTGDVAISSGTTWTASPYMRAISTTGAPLFGQDYVMEALRVQRPSLEVWYKDEGLGSNIIRPRIILKNKGTTSLSDFVYDYHFCTEGGKLPVVDPWYQVSPRLYVEALGGHCYKARYEFFGVTLAPGAELPNFSGNIIGVHYNDWTAWDRSNDWSSTNTTIDFKRTTRIPVYDRWGNLLEGEDPFPPNDHPPGGPGDGDPEPPVEIVVDPVPPVIVLQPLSRTVDVDQPVIFEVRATSDGELKYQWRENGLDIPGATGPMLRLDRVNAGQTGNHYSVHIEGPGGWVVSKDAVLKVRVPVQSLKITVQPENDMVLLGASARFEVHAVGHGTLTYQWYRNEKPILGQKESRLVVGSVLASDTSARYWVRIHDGLGRRIDSRTAKIRLRSMSGMSMRIPLEGVFRIKGEKLGGIPRDTAVDIMVRLYDKANAGAPKWEEEHWDVPVVGGSWRLEFGQTTEEPTLAQVVASSKSLYLEVLLSGPSSLVFEPRIPLTAAPYALQAGSGITLGNGSPVPRTDLGLGSFYLDLDTQTSWFHDATGWRALEP